ncbi:MAG: proline--tRNA ligase [Treponemataceae bacterium]|nr:MAG: proline--tRNA ligase [Treponemataceae bacterium]
MKASQTFIATLRDAPNDAVVASHALMLRAGLMRRLGNGLFAYLPLGLRVFRKVENIIRDEMDAIGALEFKPPFVVPAEIWQESGRWDAMGDAMLRMKNRLGQELVASPTAEEAFTALIRDELTSYKQLPIIAYQINTKYRDEIRPRYGVMRGREFTMKDAYSFSANQESLDEIYEKFAVAYRKIFERCSLSVIPVKADSGAMGGSGSEEFMVESAVGDDTLILCPKCGYAANTEKAACKSDRKESAATSEKIAEVATPNVRTIDELSAFLKRSPADFIKTLIYKAHNGIFPVAENQSDGKPSDGKPFGENFFAVCIRGDLDVNEAKLTAFLKAASVELALDADVERITGTPLGFAGPVGLQNVPIIADESVSHIHDGVTGALKKDVHFVHVEIGRDFSPTAVTDVRLVKAGDSCPVCGAEFYTKKGNELGHIFKLGYKYTKTMQVSYLDENGKAQTPIMGCYGIGVDRTLASIIEEHHDERGIVWPMAIAPYHVAIVPVKYAEDSEDAHAAKIAADNIYDTLTQAGIEVLLDDRKERPGVKFNDMDLLGIPLRIVIGKNLPQVEVKVRKDGSEQVLSIEDACTFCIKTVREASVC